jgi:hypothetical protein
MVRKRSTTNHLPRIKKEEMSVNHSNIFNGINTKQLDLPNPTTVVQRWLHDDFEPNKRVQFSQNVTVVNKTRKTKKHSSPTNNKSLSNYQQSNILPNISAETTDKKSKSICMPTAPTTETTLYRSANDRTLSVSTVASSYIAPSRHSSFSSNIFIERQHAPSMISSIEGPPSIISLPNKDRLSSIEFHSSLPEFDRRKLDDIRQLVPDEFETLLPTLIKLGVIIFPKIFLENNNQQMTTKQLIERHRLILLIEKDREKHEHERYLEHLYGSVLPKDNINQKYQSLREALSFHGQQALLSAYKDEIERELNKKIKYWRSIPMQFVKTNLSEYSYTTNKSNTLKMRKKPVKKNSSIKSSTNLSLTSNYQLSDISFPDQIDIQWHRKSIVNIIEQGMNLLDKVRDLPSTILPNISSNELFIQDTIYDINKQNIVKAFKRWLFLSSILYNEDKCTL